MLQTARFFYLLSSFVGGLVICLENVLVRGFFFRHDLAVSCHVSGYRPDTYNAFESF